MSRPLTDHEHAVFDALRNAPNIALVQVTYQGEDTAVIVALNTDEGYRYLPEEGHTYTGRVTESTGLMTPLALLVTDDMFARMINPMDES